MTSCEDDDEEEPKQENVDNGGNDQNQNGGNDQNQNGGNDQNQNGGNDQNQNGGNDQNQNGGNDQNQNGGNTSNQTSAADIYNKYKSQTGAKVIGDDVVYTLTIEGQTTVAIINFNGDNISGGKSYTDLGTETDAIKACAEAVADGEIAEHEGSIVITTMSNEDIAEYEGLPKDQLVMFLNLMGGGGLDDLLGGGGLEDLFGGLLGDE